MLLYLWLILTSPIDRIVCTLWISKLPTETALIQTCGSATLSPYRIDVTYNGTHLCATPGVQLGTIMTDCKLSGRMDDYRFLVTEPGYQTAICSVTTPANVQPSREEINQQCPDATAYATIVVKPWGTKIETKLSQRCMPPVVDQPASIATTHELHLLAGRLIWYGYVQADCPRGALTATLSATPCGLDAARPAMIDWQNSMDTEILQAAAEWNVPAAMLKQMIENETQFWSWTGSPQEHGLIQATDYAAHAVLHVYEKGYYALTPNQRASARAAWLAQLDCQACNPKQAIAHAKRQMSHYAQTLAAYYCMYGSWSDALKAWNVKYKQEN